MILATTLQILWLEDYNTRLVVLGTACLGIAAGAIGSLLLLRRRALIGDVISHATLPGVGIAFLLMVAWGGSGRWMPGLLLGAATVGLLAAGLVVLIRKTTLLRDDAAMAIMLSTTFGLGIVLLSVVQESPAGTQAGLESMIFGKTASMVRSDAIGIGIAALTVLTITATMFKEFRMLCFDEGFATSQGWPVGRLDLLLLLLGTAVTVIGLQAVGLILVLALLIIPATAARFWTDHLLTMMVVAAIIGGLSGWLGVTASALATGFPAGAVIVLVATGFFLISLLIGRRRGVLGQVSHRIRRRRAADRQHLLRAVWEERERGKIVHADQLLHHRSWTRTHLNRLIRRGQARGDLRTESDGEVILTERGEDSARTVVRNHRLWELFLIRHADIAPNHVDRDADAIEHVLSEQLVRELERLLDPDGRLPRNPHELRAEEGST